MILITSPKKKKKKKTDASKNIYDQCFRKWKGLKDFLKTKT